MLIWINQQDAGRQRSAGLRATAAAPDEASQSPQCRWRPRRNRASRPSCGLPAGQPLASYYLWRSKFGGLSVPEAKRLKELETENGRLKKLLAEQVLENEVIKEALRKKW
jgi:hypothetical protein